MDPKPQMNELQTLVHPVKMNPGPVLYRPLPAKSGLRMDSPWQGQQSVAGEGLIPRNQALKTQHSF